MKAKNKKSVALANEFELTDQVRRFMIIRLAESLGEFDETAELDIRVDGELVHVAVTELIGNGAVLSQRVRFDPNDEDAIEAHHYVVVRQYDGMRIGQFEVVDNGSLDGDKQSMLELAKFVFADE